MTAADPADLLPAAYLDNYDRIAADHLLHYRATGQNPWTPESLVDEWERVTVEHIARYAPAGSILDCGVGMGRLLARFPGRQRHGVDIAGEYLAEARRHGIRAKRAALEDLPYPARRFAAVVCTDVLEHVLDPDPCMAEMARVLRVGGHLFVRTPWNEDVASQVSPYEYVHLRGYTEETHREAFARVGLEVLEVHVAFGEVHVVGRK